MVFIDLDNFRKGLFLKDNKRFYDFGKFPYFIIRFLKNNLHIESCRDESLIRTYVYTGEYPAELARKIENQTKLENYKKRMWAQRKFFEKIKDFNYFELKTLPLKYEDGKIFQKGVDVQMAVDMVYHAFSNNFDIVIICSGDIDLKEAVKLIKKFGKKVIIISHPKLASKELIKEADVFIDIEKFKDVELDEFSRVK